VHIIPESHLPESLNSLLQGALVFSDRSDMTRGPRLCLYNSLMSVAMKQQTQTMCPQTLHDAVKPTTLKKKKKVQL